METERKSRNGSNMRCGREQIVHPEQKRTKNVRKCRRRDSVLEARHILVPKLCEQEEEEGGYMA
jgi:hypothetical protein